MRVEQLAVAERVRVGDQRARVAVFTERERGDAARQRVEQVDAGRAGRREVAFLGVVRPLAIADAIDQLGDQPVEVGVALAVRVRRHVDRHAVDEGREVGAVVEVEAAQVVLVRLAVAAVLRHDHAGHELEHLGRPQGRPALDQLRGHGAGAGRVGAADGVEIVAAHLRRRQLLRCARVGDRGRGRCRRRGRLGQRRRRRGAGGRSGGGEQRSDDEREAGATGAHAAVTQRRSAQMRCAPDESSTRSLRLVALDLEHLAPAASMRTAVSLPPQTQPVSSAEQVGAVDQAERRPVAERDRRACACVAPGASNHGEKPGGAASAPSLVRELERAVGGDEAGARQRVEGEAQARVAARAIRSSAAARCRTSPPGTRAAAARAARALELAGERERRAPGPTAARRRRAASASPARERPCGAGAPSRARPRGRARRGCRRACRCGGAAARRRPRRAGASRGCRARRSRRRRGRAAGAGCASDAGPRLTRSPST